MLDNIKISENDLFHICGLKTPEEFKASILFDSSESIRHLLQERGTGKTTEIIIKSLYNILLGRNVLIWVSNYQSQRRCGDLIRKYSKIINGLCLEEPRFCRFVAKNIKNNPSVYIIFLHNNFPQSGDFYSLRWDIEFDDSNPFE